MAEGFGFRLLKTQAGHWGRAKIGSSLGFNPVEPVGMLQEQVVVARCRAGNKIKHHPQTENMTSFDKGSEFVIGSHTVT